MKILPIISLTNSWKSNFSISPKIVRENSMASGTTALLKAARIPVLVMVAPLFHRKSPIQKLQFQGKELKTIALELFLQKLY